MEKLAMTEDEEFIAAFLRVFEWQPELFEEVEVVEAIGELDDMMADCKNASNQEVADAISNWCAYYPDITDAVVMEISASKDSLAEYEPKQETLTKLYPNLVKNLRKRI
ncbi:MAG: hypothetical protein GDA48_15615 [Hormoscilla sp. GM102CHS1]|nr:hypothetical protein [Hormoscilla sp. GM102CHS1]